MSKSNQKKGSANGEVDNDRLSSLNVAALKYDRTKAKRHVLWRPVRALSHRRSCR